MRRSATEPSSSPWASTRTCPTASMILDEVQSAGYAGIDLGPVGYLGDGPVLAERLASRQLGLAGAYLEFPFTDHEALPALYPGTRRDARHLRRGARDVPGPVPHPTIADSGSERRRNNPGPQSRRPLVGTRRRRVGPHEGGTGRRSSSAVAPAATSRRSTTRPAPTWRRRGRSSASSTSRTSGSVSTPGTSSSVAVTRSWRSTSGPTASTTCT